VPERDEGKSAAPTVIIGLGNDLLSDDGVGIRVLRALAERAETRSAELHEAPIGGLGLLDHILGHERCIIVDAIATGTHPPGTLMQVPLTEGAAPAVLSSSHQIDLLQVLALARMMGGDVPRSVTVYGIEAKDVTTFHEGCTEEVALAIPGAVDAICAELSGKGAPPPTGPPAWRIAGGMVPAR